MAEGYMDYDDKNTFHHAKKSIRECINYEFSQQDVDGWCYSDGSGDFLSSDQFHYTKDAKLIIHNQSTSLRFIGIESIIKFYKQFQNSHLCINHQIVNCEILHFENDNFITSLTDVTIMEFVEEDGKLCQIISRVHYEDRWVQRMCYSNVLYIKSRIVKILWAYKVPAEQANNQCLI